MAKISVLIADDHEIVRFGISTFLSSADDVEVVGEASTGKECITLFQETHPDICILDIDMPDQSGIETAKEIREFKEETKILILSMHINENILREALEANINGYLLKNSEKADILHGIKAIIKGQQVFSDPISDIMKESFLNKGNQSGSHAKHNITSREQEILQLIIDGLTSKQIADKLYISPRTVDTHRANLMEKLEINNIAELVRYAIQHNLVTVD
ncbi:DNA-binding response regulator [Aliifodinibius salipaludis]|uniref:DNA-binding response regulator n=1 Tax=Fodinibius salipaludis TaxID=2032627 RepID=A0A2A2GAZ4_9BACT|nr:response regulator transcription factor [Aliifodinibius salipaludis]PAU94360.1 DNA-binding response regulator [Aliifodinibius salipaludis]